MPLTNTRRHTEMRAEEKGRWRAVNAPCSLCGQAAIDWDASANTPDALEVEHTLPVVTHPHLEFEPVNRHPSHHRCNRTKGAGPARPGIGTTSEVWRLARRRAD